MACSSCAVYMRAGSASNSVPASSSSKPPQNSAGGPAGTSSESRKNTPSTPISNVRGTRNVCTALLKNSTFPNRNNWVMPSPAYFFKNSSCDASQRVRCCVKTWALSIFSSYT